MKDTCIFGNYGFEILKDDPSIEGNCWVMITWQNETIKDGELAPDCSWASDWHKTVQEAALTALDRLWADQKDGGYDRMIQAASGMIACGILPNTFKVGEGMAFIDGILYHGYADNLHPERDNGLHPWYTYTWKRLEEYSFSPAGTEMAKEIIRDEVMDMVEFNKSYEAWEATWIDGPQW